jgi:hypothetical protein
MRIPYTYILESVNGHLYVGSKYGVDANPENLLKTYFTSSKYARPLILEDVSKWKIIRLQEGKTTEEVVAREMDWQLEFKHHKGMLNKSINRAQGKWINYGPKSDETRRKISEARRGRANTPEVAAAIGLKNRGLKRTAETRALIKQRNREYWDTVDDSRRAALGKAISASMKMNGTSVGAKNANTTKWILRSPDGVVLSQPENLSGKEFIQGLGLSYQMLIKFRSKNQVFSGKLAGWEVLDCSRQQGQNQHRSGRSIKRRSE